jgi:hypothetical protein
MIYAANHGGSSPEDETEVDQVTTGRHDVSCLVFTSFYGCQAASPKNTTSDRRWTGVVKLASAWLQGKEPGNSLGRNDHGVRWKLDVGSRGHELRFQRSPPSFWKECFDRKLFQGTVGLNVCQSWLPRCSPVSNFISRPDEIITT